MTDTFVIALIREALVTVLLVSAPMLGVGLIVGLVISVLQATTQIHEQTLTFIPKILAVLLAMIFFAIDDTTYVQRDRKIYSTQLR